MNEETFDLSFIFGVIRKRFLLILFFIILGFWAAFAYNYVAPVKYNSATTLYVKPNVSASGDVDYQTILTNQKMVTTYAQIMRSRKVINKVIKNLDLNLGYGAIIEGLNISSVSNTELISVSMTINDPEIAYEIVTEVSKVFMEEIKEMMDISNISVIDEPTLNKAPVAPNEKLNLCIGLVGGTFLGLILAFLAETMDNKIKNHEDVKKYLKLKTLGVVPHSNIDDDNTKYRKDNKKLDLNGQEGHKLKIIYEPTSVVSESIRMLRTNLNFLDLKVINMTSTLPSEGKTEVITNLSVAFALLGKKVLIMDCDLRKPKVHRKFGIPRKEGISNIVLSNGKTTIDDVVTHFSVDDKGTNVDVLGPGAKVSNPSELINSKEFEKLIADAKQKYDLVLIDCPPVSMMADGIIVSRLTDGTVYVIESDRTDYRVVNSCIEQLEANKAFILGVVLNKVNVKDQKKLYGYKYDYYYSNYN